MCALVTAASAVMLALFKKNSESAFDANEVWVVAAVGFGSALLGALVGAVSSLLLDVWRRSLDGIAAARTIRMEFIRNRVVVQSALDGREVTPPLAGAAWQQYVLAVAPLMHEIELSKMSRDQAVTVVAQGWIDSISLTSSVDAQAKNKTALANWSADLRLRCRELHQLEEKRKLWHMCHLLFKGRPASEEELIAAFLPDLTGQ